MGIIKNTCATVKRNPKALTQIAGSILNTYLEAMDYKNNGVSFANIFGLTASAITLGKNLRDVFEEIREADKFRITINNENPIAKNVLLEWVGEANSESRYFEASAFFRDGEVDLLVVPTHEQATEVKAGDHILSIDVDKTPIMRNGSPTGEFLSSIEVSADTEEGFKAFQEEFMRRITVALADDDRQTYLYTQSLYASSGYNPHAPLRRPLDSVVLRDGTMGRITEHIQRFRDSRDLYEKKGYPYHTGILFYGPPGTGKTSISGAVANKFQMDMYQLTLSNIESDSELIEWIGEVPEDSIILLEDIDVATRASRDRDDSAPSEDEITLTGLLNVLDGNFSPHGCIFILTTNDKDALDPALTRPGRVDLDIEIGYTDDKQVVDLCNYYIGHVPEGLPKGIEEWNISSAKIVSVFRNNIGNDEEAGRELVRFLKERIAELCSTSADSSDLTPKPQG